MIFIKEQGGGIEMKDPRNELIVYGILIGIFGFVVVGLTQKIGYFVIGLSCFSGLFISTGLVFKIPFISNNIVKPKQKPKIKYTRSKL